MSYPLSGVLDITGYGQGALKKLDELDTQGQVAGEGGSAIMSEALHWIQTYPPQLFELFEVDGSQKKTVASGKIRLEVKVRPDHARVRVMNIRPAYEPGMLLDAGVYDIEITAPGYQPFREKLSFQSGRPPLTVVLQEK